jgi:hypothetical protein
LLTAQITGGLGNQLLTYARLALHARENQIDLKIDGSITERVLGGPPDLFDFRLTSEERVGLSDYSAFRVQTERIFWKSEQTRKITKRHQDSLLGNQNSLSKVKNGWRVRGFFQDFAVAEHFLEKFGRDPFVLIQESRELQRRSFEVSKNKSLAIHMRRGDYLSHIDSFGVLEDNYYLSALEKIRNITELEKIYIFSDSPESVINFQKRLKLDSEIVSPSDLKPSETLVLMSRCAAIITSNSTFSFWAAILASHNDVIYPDPWFRSSDQWLSSANFQNPNWVRAESEWLK